MNCNQCVAAMINGVLCHETGCPSAKKQYDTETGEWRTSRKCFECGYTVWADDPCCQGEQE